MRKIIEILKFLVKLNWIKTLIFNFCCFPLKVAIKFPVFIMGPCKLAHLKGKVVLEGPIESGMVCIGDSDPFRSFYSKSYFSNFGTIILHKGVILRKGISLACWGHLELKHNVVLGDNCSIICTNIIQIGTATRVGNNTTFMDTDFHYIVNTENRSINKNCKPVIIGANNWIGGWCVIKKGTQTPEGTIIAGPYSSAGKNYIGVIPEYSLIAGSPAKLIRTGFRRVNNNDKEQMLRRYFADNDAPYVVNENINLDEFCLPLK